MPSQHLTFTLLDLASQARAVQPLLAGCSHDEKINWLKAHGRLTFAFVDPWKRSVYHFESIIGLQCSFCFDGNAMVFLGDNTCWSVPSWRHPALDLKTTP